MPLFYYVSDSEKDTLQKPLDAERLLRMLGASGKLAGFRQTAYMIEQARDTPNALNSLPSVSIGIPRGYFIRRATASSAICGQ